MVRLLLSLLLVSGFVLGQTRDYFADKARSTAITLKFGRNVEIDSGDAEDIWDVGGTWNQPTVGQTIYILGSSDLDSVGLGGMTSVTIYGLDSLWATASETIVLVGTDSAWSVNKYQIVYRMIGASYGDSLSNQGTVTVYGSVDTLATAQIAIGNNQTLMAIFGVPANRVGLIHTLYASVNSAQASGSGDIEVWIKPFGLGWTLKGVFGVHLGGGSHFQHFYKFPLVLQPKSLIKIRTVSGVNNLAISAGFDIEIRSY